MSQAIGSRQWAIPEGYLPAVSHGPEPQMTSHGALCILNASDRPAHLELTIYFSDREAVGPYLAEVPARRTLHLRFNNLKNPEPVPRETNFSSVLKSDVPVVVQYTRLDSRQAENALMTTLAFPGEG